MGGTSGCISGTVSPPLGPLLDWNVLDGLIRLRGGIGCGRWCCLGCWCWCPARRYANIPAGTRPGRPASAECRGLARRGSLEPLGRSPRAQEHRLMEMWREWNGGGLRRHGRGDAGGFARRGTHAVYANPVALALRVLAALGDRPARTRHTKQHDQPAQLFQSCQSPHEFDVVQHMAEASRGDGGRCLLEQRVQLRAKERSSASACGASTRVGELSQSTSARMCPPGVELPEDPGGMDCADEPPAPLDRQVDRNSFAERLHVQSGEPGELPLGWAMDWMFLARLSALART